MNRMSKLALSLVAAATVSTALTGCFPLVLGGAQCAFVIDGHDAPIGLG